MIKQKYYSIPLDLGKAMRGAPLAQTDIRQAIHQNIRLMLSTLTLSYRFDPAFGCVLNKYQARTPDRKAVERAWREEMRVEIEQNIKDLLQRYETRISVSEVTVELQNPTIRASQPVVMAVVEISGRLSLGNKERFHFPDSEIEEAAQGVFPLMIPIGKM